MADYKRMVSYMYQYENGVKRRNVGYARIEAKNGQCKITLHMQLLGQLDSIFPTYLIQRDANNMELIYLGDTVLKNQVMDSKLTATETNIMNSGHSLSEMGGMLLFLNDSIFFATEWDDKPIIAKEVLEALKPKKKKESFERLDKVEALPTESYYVKDEVVEQAPIAEVMGKTVSNYQPEASSYDNRDDIVNFPGSGERFLSDDRPPKESDTKNKRLYSSAEELSNQMEANLASMNNADQAEEVFDYYASQKLSLEEELKLPKYKLPRGWKTIERLQKNPAYEVSMSENVLEAADIASPEAMQAERVDQSEHIEMQQNLFGEFLEQFNEQFSELEDEMSEDNNLEGFYRDEENRSDNRTDQVPLNSYLGEDSLYEDEPISTQPPMEEIPDLSDDASMDLPYDWQEGTPEDDLEELPDGMEEAPEDQPVPGEEEMAEEPEPMQQPIREEMAGEPEPMQQPIREEMAGEPEPVQQPIREEMAGEPEPVQQPISDGMAEEQEPPIAKQFFDNYPRIYPFEDSEVIFCVKIEPKDIGMLPKEVWPMSNNSFLMHGFYCYHHLIFAKLKNRYGTFYILGIPGIYHNRERFMAKMFGFENFKSIRKRDLRQGDFGYWYLPINF